MLPPLFLGRELSVDSDLGARLGAVEAWSPTTRCWTFARSATRLARLDDLRLEESLASCHSQAPGSKTFQMLEVLREAQIKNPCEISRQCIGHKRKAVRLLPAWQGSHRISHACCRVPECSAQILANELQWRRANMLTHQASESNAFPCFAFPSMLHRWVDWGRHAWW